MKTQASTAILLHPNYPVDFYTLPEIVLKSFHPVIILASFNRLHDSFQIGPSTYLVYSSGIVVGPKGTVLKAVKTPRRANSGHDLTVRCSGIKLRISRLNAHVFLGMPLRSRKQANHLNYDTNDCRLSNIEISTPKRNARHREERKLWKL